MRENVKTLNDRLRDLNAETEKAIVGMMQEAEVAMVSFHVLRKEVGDLFESVRMPVPTINDNVMETEVYAVFCIDGELSVATEEASLYLSSINVMNKKVTAPDVLDVRETADLLDGVDMTYRPEDLLAKTDTLNLLLNAVAKALDGFPQENKNL